jgi:hypothetical protein
MRKNGRDNSTKCQGHTSPGMGGRGTKEGEKNNKKKKKKKKKHNPP